MGKINIPAAIVFVLAIACNSGEQKQAADSNADTTKAKQDTVAAKKNIVFMGNSITAGYGLQLSEAFPALIQNRIDSLRLPYSTVNAGVSGETSADGLARIDWLLRQPVDIFVLELGGNDGLRGIPVSETKKNLQAIIQKVKTKYPQAQIILAGMQIPPNMGKRYTDEFRKMFPDLAKENDVKLIPFLLEGVGGEKRLNMEDGIHPTAEGHRILAENVWRVVEPMVRES
jgi:acyl-CoA thioesterase-1